MKVFFGGDHAGVELKGKLVEFVRSLGYEVFDFGPKEYDENDDYPDFVIPVAQAIRNDSEQSRGVIIGGSGQGEAIVANRFKRVRATVYYGGDPEIVKISREHNDSNILAIGARFASVEEAKRAVELWLKAPFSGDGRHFRRNKKIDELTK